VNVAATALQPAQSVIGAADYARAMLNILVDFGDEKAQLHDMQSAILNIIDDAAGEKTQLERTQRAVLNILDDSASERLELESTQRAVLNILEDVDTERNVRSQAEAEVRVLNEGLEGTGHGAHGGADRGQPGAGDLRLLGVA
jgi:hypothetical protein